jgi:tRNA threonylcarbamoyladenosine biosynthesis protein TsaE
MVESKELFSAAIQTPEEMNELGLRLAQQLKAGDLALLIGPLGAGKTTLARGIGAGLEVEGNVSSPTFVIARTHKRGDKAPLVHVDAYRLKSAYEFDDLDIPYSSSIVLVEWGKGLTEDIVESWMEINISRDHSGETEVREVTVTGFGERWAGVEI